MKKAIGTLNSKSPNPFELVYKELWDKLPEWKKNAFAEENANGRCSALHSEFLKQVSIKAEELYDLRST